MFTIHVYMHLFFPLLPLSRVSQRFLFLNYIQWHATTAMKTACFSTPLGTPHQLSTTFFLLWTDFQTFTHRPHRPNHCPRRMKCHQNSNHPTLAVPRTPHYCCCCWSSWSDPRYPVSWWQSWWRCQIQFHCLLQEGCPWQQNHRVHPTQHSAALRRASLGCCGRQCPAHPFATHSWLLFD